MAAWSWTELQRVATSLAPRNADDPHPAPGEMSVHRQRFALSCPGGCHLQAHPEHKRLSPFPKPAARLHLVTESPELRAPPQNTAMELNPINNPPARPAPHPICLLIPSADDDELQDLTDDIRAHGLIAPIVLFEGMILDGRNRAAACERAGIAPRYVQFGGGREDALILVVSHNLKRRHLTKQAIADALVAAEDFNLHYTLAGPVAAAGADGPEAQSVIKITEPKTASSRKLAQAAGRVVSHVMIAATRKVKEKGEPELQEAVKKGRIGVQDAAKAADLPPEQQKAIAGSPKPRRAAAEAAEAAMNASRAGGTEPRSDVDGQAALQKAWKGAKALRGLWETADGRTKEWFVGAVLFDLNEADHRERSAIESLDEPADEKQG